MGRKAKKPEVEELHFDGSPGRPTGWELWKEWLKDNDGARVKRRAPTLDEYDEDAS